MGVEIRELQRAEQKTDKKPSQQQIKTGNYNKGTVSISGLDIVIENPKGSIRSGVDIYGKPWSNTIKHTYGYFDGTIGSDGDGVDVFIGPEIENTFEVYIIDQVNERTREFDEHKVMFGFKSPKEAVVAYLSNYEDDWTGFKDLTVFTLDEFKRWLHDDNATKIPAKQKPMPQLENYVNEANGDNINIITLKGEVEADITLLDLQKQAKGIKPGETLVLEIASPGGSVSEGLLIMQWLNMLSESGVQIITCVTANAYSIASLIMLVADIRLISVHAKVMVHNPMVPELSYVNANELEQHINSLRELEGFMYELYKAFTGLSEDQIRLLMDNETYLTPHEAVTNGFADMVVSIKKTPYEMASKPEKTVNMSKTVNVLKQVIAKLQGNDFVNQTYYDDEGGEVEIYQADGAQYQIGDKTSVGDGEYKLADGAKLIVKEGSIEDIIKGDIEQQETPIEEEAPEAQDGPMGELDTPSVVEDVIEGAPAEPEAAEFNEGPAPVEPKAADQIPGKVVETTKLTTKETTAQATPEVEAVVEPEAVVEEMVSVPAEAFKAMQEEMKSMQAKMENQASQIAAQAISNGSFQEVAAEAIDVLAKNTSSVFQPDARVTTNVESLQIGKNSIFQRAKAKAGLAK